jgi:ASC-1-like (ASCH) protein
MKKQILAMALAALMGGDCLGRTPPSDRPTPKEYVHTIASGSTVEVRLADGSKLRGWISEVSDTGFELRYEKRKQLQQEQITFDQVKTVKQVNNVKTSHTARNVLIGVGIGVGIGVVVSGVVAAIALASGGGINLMGGGWGM